jgi:hypothetical protein
VDLGGTEEGEGMAREAQPLGDGSIMAAGGWCAPSELVYDRNLYDDAYVLPTWTLSKPVSITFDNIDPGVFDILTGNDWDPSE